jgi:general secretion pathway protein G
VLLNVAPQMGQGSQAAAKSQIQVFSSAIDTYRMPMALSHPAAGPRGPRPQALPGTRAGELSGRGYLNAATSRSTPEAAQLYLCPGRQNEPFEILSYGADGEPGGSGGDADFSSVNAQKRRRPFFGGKTLPDA